MRNILVLRGGALGDFIVTLPALASLRERWPHARIELAGNATAAELARTRGLLDQVHSQHEARWATLFSPSPLPAEFAAWLAEFDLVLSYWPDPDGDLARRFPVRAGQTYLCAPAMPTRAPAAAHYCGPLKTLGVEPREFLFRLSPLPSLAAGTRVGAESGCHRGPGIAVHPGSGSPRKNWPAQNWECLLASLPPPVSLVLGEAEMKTWGSEPVAETAGGSARTNPQSHAATCIRFGAAASLPSGTARVVRKNEPHRLIHPPLEDLVAHLTECRLFLGHDSGVSHLAAACGVRCVLLFGPTDPAIWAPPAPHVRVLQHAGALSAISVEEVRAAVASALAGQR